MCHTRMHSQWIDGWMDDYLGSIHEDIQAMPDSEREGRVRPEAASFSGCQSHLQNDVPFTWRVQYEELFSRQ